MLRVQASCILVNKSAKYNNCYDLLLIQRTWKFSCPHLLEACPQIYSECLQTSLSHLTWHLVRRALDLMLQTISGLFQLVRGYLMTWMTSAYFSIWFVVLNYWIFCFGFVLNSILKRHAWRGLRLDSTKTKNVAEYTISVNTNNLFKRPRATHPQSLKGWTRAERFLNPCAQRHLLSVVQHLLDVKTVTLTGWDTKKTSYLYRCISV